MAKPGRSRAERKRAEAIAGWTKIIGGVGVVGGVIGAYLYLSANRQALDPITLCPDSPVSLTVLLVDVTDPMTRAQRKDFINQMDRLRAQIPRYGRLVVARVDEKSEDLVSPVIERCNPGTAADVTAATGDPAGVQAQHDQGFKAPLASAFMQLSQAKPSDRSPIFEAIQSVALSELQKPAMDGKPRKLVVVSDLLQHTPPSLNFYRQLPSPDELLDGAAFQTVRTDLSGVNAELWMLQRADTSSTQPRALVDLWTEAMTEQGASVDRVYRVSG